MIAKLHNHSKHVEYWYDTTPRCWYAVPVNNIGIEVGAVLVAVHKKEILRRCKELAFQCGDTPASSPASCLKLGFDPERPDEDTYSREQSALLVSTNSADERHEAVSNIRTHRKLSGLSTYRRNNH